MSSMLPENRLRLPASKSDIFSVDFGLLVCLLCISLMSLLSERLCDGVLSVIKRTFRPFLRVNNLHIKKENLAFTNINSDL